MSGTEAAYPGSGALSRRTPVVVLGAALLLAALNLRPAVASVSPVLGAIRKSTGLSPVGAGLLTTLPLLCFGLLAFAAPASVRRWGASRVLVVCLVATTAGTALRSLPGLVSLFAGTLVIGAAVAIANVLMPGIVKKDFPTRVGLMTGLYTMALTAGPAFAAGFSVPLEHALGSWRLSLGFWALPAALAVVAWLPLRNHDGPEDIDVGSPGRQVSAADPVAWAVMVYMGIQSLIFYALLAWYPTILQSRGTSAVEAGYFLALLNLVGIVAALVAPLVAHRTSDQRLAAAVSTLAFAGGIGGLLLDPHHGLLLWSTLIGIGQGSSVSLALMMMVVRARDTRQANALSGAAQGVGYLIGAAGPTLAGALYSATGGWRVPLLFLLALLVPQAVSGWVGGHGQVRQPPEELRLS